MKAKQIKAKKVNTKVEGLDPNKIEIMNTKILRVDSSTGFKFLAGINREIIPHHVSAIVAAILFLKAIIRPITITTISFIDGVATRYIVDGQHLYTALLRLKLPIPYVEIKINSLEELIEAIAKLNTTSKTWTLADYINTWSYYKPEYKTFKRLFNLYNIERGILAELLHTGIVTATGRGGSKESVTKAVKEGRLRILNEKLATQVLDYVTDLREVMSDIGRVEQKLVISAIIEKIKADGGSYNHKEYKKYLISIKKELILASNDIDAIRVLLAH